MKVATQYTRGRVLFETPEQLRTLDDQMTRLRDWKEQIRDAIAPRLRTTRDSTNDNQWGSALDIVGLTSHEAITIEIAGRRRGGTEASNSDVKRALRGFPYTNPLTQIWELRQMECMYQAADDLLEDTWCDLVAELEPRHGWNSLADMALNQSADQLKERLQRQQSQRGTLGDDRRLPRQNYPTLPAGQ